MFGNAHGGSAYVSQIRLSLPLMHTHTNNLPSLTIVVLFSHTLIPPRGYNICGVTGSCGPWIDGFSVIITR